LTLLAAAILATFAPPRIEWLPCLVVTPDNEVVEVASAGRGHAAARRDADGCAEGQGEMNHERIGCS
jgi:hypothetical protein